ncbi:MAG: SEC-C domain-containing protein [Clostridiaceae bacterium]|jgi:preprotein translocase subunit SecA|nr:SEC-C domain-containing protein [Clostridiaceae bacterium]
MSLFGEWQKRLENQNKNPENQMFFENYLQKETEAYKKILGSGITSLTGKLADLAETYDMDNVTFMGFLDGINTSLDSKLDLESLTGESHIDKAILHYKLYYNMLNAKANWLYELAEWDSLLSLEERLQIRKKFNEDHRAVSNKVGRNDPCPCGSGKKYKKCCGAN